MARYVDVYDLNNNFRGELCNHIDCDNCTFHRGAYFCRLGDYLLKYETADVAPVIHAHWTIIYESTAGVTDAKCSNCGYESLAYENDVHTDEYCNYCPCCGAKMDEEVE